MTAFIIQLPLPEGIDPTAMLELMDPAKDADGLHPVNLGELVLAVPGGKGTIDTPLPCTPRGIVEMLRRTTSRSRGQHVTIIGQGLTVGRPLGLLLTPARGDRHADALAHRRRGRRGARADIVVAAAGVAGLVKPDWVKPGAAVIDVGITRVLNEETGKCRLRGDVDPAVAAVAGCLSPVPGGVGPMTRAMLLPNVVEAAERPAAERAAAAAPAWRRARQPEPRPDRRNPRRCRGGSGHRREPIRLCGAEPERRAAAGQAVATRAPSAACTVKTSARRSRPPRRRP